MTPRKEETGRTMNTGSATTPRAVPHLVFPFYEAEGLDVSLLGGKGAGLVRMTTAGLPVPPGFVITTEACQLYATGTLPEAFWKQILEAMQDLEERSQRNFGHGGLPLLVSVRSGAPVSMPGMMDTILNLGLSDASLVALASSTGDVAFAVDTFVRFARMFTEIVFGADADDALLNVGREITDAAPGDVLPPLVAAVAEAVEQASGQRLPLDPWQQLRMAIEAVFRSWNSRRAVRYREFHGIPHDLGTAVVVQQMVFGNFGTPCGTGVAFTRDPRTGEATLYGEFLERGQGEDIVSGTHTPESLTEVSSRYPKLIAEFKRAASQLEWLYQDILDIEFTVEDGKLYLLQVRIGKRTAEAAVRTAIDLVEEGLIDPATAVDRVVPDQIRQIRQPRFEPSAVDAARGGGRLLATGVGASPGQVTGVLVTDADRAEKRASAGEQVLLVRTTTSPQDLHGMLASVGVVTARGGATSHAAVVARSLDKPCIVGCEAVRIDLHKRVVSIQGRHYPEGTVWSIDGATGEIFDGALPAIRSAGSLKGQLARLLAWADDRSGCELYTRVATADMARAAAADGAVGIGVRIEEVMAASDGLDHLIGVLGALSRGAAEPDTAGMEAAISTALGAVLCAVQPQPFLARSIDLTESRAGDMVRELTRRAIPAGIWLPLGIPHLVRAQVRAVREAVLSIDSPGPVTMMAGGLSGLPELRELRAICREEAGDLLQVGVAVRSPCGLLALGDFVREADVIWLDYRALTAAVYHYPDELLLSEAALSEYLERGMLPSDPRQRVGAVLARLMELTANLPQTDCELGVNFVGWTMSEDILEFFRRAGYRRFAVDSDETLPARLLLGQSRFAGDAKAPV